MDLSTGHNNHETREWILRNSPVPVSPTQILFLLERTGLNSSGLHTAARTSWSRQDP